MRYLVIILALALLPGCGSGSSGAPSQSGGRDTSTAALQGTWTGTCGSHSAACTAVIQNDRTFTLTVNAPSARTVTGAILNDGSTTALNTTAHAPATAGDISVGSPFGSAILQGSITMSDGQMGFALPTHTP